MGYTVEYSKEALKTLRRLARNVALNIQQKVGQLAADPQSMAANIKKLQGREGYRLRVGDYRVIYTLDGEKLVIVVLQIGSRGDIYD